MGNAHSMLCFRLVSGKQKGYHPSRVGNGSYFCNWSMSQGDDEGLWGKLPEDLTKRILGKLPFSSLIRFRCVCKKWNSWILSRHVLPANHRHKTMLLHSDVLSTMASPYPAVYNSNFGYWEKLGDKLSLSFLPEKLSSLWLVASGGGLLCYETNFFGDFIVCNPITKQWKRLQVPCQDDKRNHPHVAALPYRIGFGQFKGEIVVSLFVDSGSERRGYQLLVAGIYEGSRRTTLVYHSVAGTWEKVGNVPQGRQFRTQPITWNGNLYCLMGPGDDLYTGPYRLLRYDCQAKNWSTLLIPDRLGVPCQLVHFADQLLLLTNYNHTWSFQQLESGIDMLLIGKPMPKQLMEDLSDRKGFKSTEILCHGKDDQAMYFCDPRGELYGSRIKLGKIYNFITTFGSWLPTPEGDSDDTWVVWRVFTPSLHPVL